MALQTARRSPRHEILRCAQDDKTLSLARRIVLDDLLVDGPEDRLAGAVEHLDADPVAELHEGCRGLASVDRLAHAPLGDAGTADRRIAVGDRTGADHCAGFEIAGLGRMRD